MPADDTGNEGERNMRTIRTQPERRQQMVDWMIGCTAHRYICLYRNKEIVMGYSNLMHSMEEIMGYVEHKTGCRFTDIPIRGRREDFTDLMFAHVSAKDEFERQMGLQEVRR